jgi:erythritol transport system ATP-binding protein
VHPDATGEIRLGPDSLETLDVSDRVEAGLAMVPEDRQAAGLIGTMSVRENMTLSSLARLARYGYLAPASEAGPARELTAALRIKAPGPHAPIGTLSGGNQQKVVIARGVMSRPRVLLLDEPTRGVDVGARAEILETMRTLAAGGLGVMFASSEIDEVRAGATRILVMARGRLTGTFDAGTATDDQLASAASATEGGGPC